MVKAAAQPYKHTTTVCHAGQQWYSLPTVSQDSSDNQV